MPATLKRSLSLFHIVLYGMGTTIGAGIYALVGEISGIAGYLAPASFLVASLLASLTALSFAELSGRYPQAAGAALYTEKGFSSTYLALAIGLLVCMAGIVSSSALIHAFVGYLAVYIDINASALIIITTLLIGTLAIWGIAESVTVASMITLVEIGGLLLIIFVSRHAYLTLPAHFTSMIPALNQQHLLAVSGGAILAFYAFIGFEDMVEVTEETKDASHTLPKAILMTIAITSLIYLLVMTAAILSMPPTELAKSKTPLSLIYEKHTGHTSSLLNIIGMVAVINGAIIQMIMSSRVLYGLSHRGQLPKALGVIHPRTHTPVIATIAVIALILLLALTGKLVSLAEMTSMLVLVTYSVVNLSLWRIKKKHPRVDGIFYIPRIIPLLAFTVCIGFVMSQISKLLL